MTAPTLEELEAILGHALAQVAAAKARRDANPTPPDEAEERVAEAEREAAETRKRLSQLLQEQRELDERYRSATAATTADELRQVDERRGQLVYDVWEARVACEKAAIHVIESKRAAASAGSVSSRPGLDVVQSLAEQLRRFQTRLVNWRTARDPRFSGLSSELGDARIRLDKLLANPPSGRAVRAR